MANNMVLLVQVFKWWSLTDTSVSSVVPSKITDLVIINGMFLFTQPTNTSTFF